MLLKKSLVQIDFFIASLNFAHIHIHNYIIMNSYYYHLKNISKLNTSFYAIFKFVESDVFYCVIICNFLFLLSLCCTSFSLLMSISQSLCQFFIVKVFSLKSHLDFFCYPVLKCLLSIFILQCNALQSNFAQLM
jgi:hypothetical protein